MPKGVYPRKIKDITGQTWTRLTAIRYVGRDIWIFRCSCDGKEIERRGSDVTRGFTKSCGCLAAAQRGENHPMFGRIGEKSPMFGRRGEDHPMFGRRGKDSASFKHGHSSGYKVSPTLVSYQSMVQRVTDSNHEHYPYYGGAGVKVDPRWLGEHGFEAFLADMGERPANTTLGRFLDSGNYEPGNCAWQTISEQALERKKHYAQQPTGKKYQKANQPISVLAS